MVSGGTVLVQDSTPRDQDQDQDSDPRDQDQDSSPQDQNQDSSSRDQDQDQDSKIMPRGSLEAVSRRGSASRLPVFFLKKKGLLTFSIFELLLRTRSRHIYNLYVGQLQANSKNIENKVHIYQTFLNICMLL